MQSQTSIISKIVQAGAGTGKTESLAREVIFVAKKLFKQHNRMPQIVATTFTEQATVELRQRIIQVVESSESESWLKEFVRNTDKLQISTIHGIFAKILHKHGPLIGLDPEFSILKSEEEKKVVRVLLRKKMSENVDASMLVDQYGFEGCIQLLLPLMQHIHQYGSNAQDISSWEELIEKDIKKLKKALSEISNALTEGYTPALQQTIEVLKRLHASVVRFGSDYEKMREYLLEILQGERQPIIKSKGVEIKNALADVFEIKKRWQEECFDVAINVKHEQLTKTLFSVAAQLLLLVNEFKTKVGKLSFSDLELFLRDLLNQKAELKTHIQDFYDYWFVDEFQDTSPLQKEILFSFFKNPLNVYFVGDPQQSIYLFRGADKNVFDEAKILVQKSGGEQKQLKINYRSQGDIIKFLNKLFSPLEPKEPSKDQVATQICFHTEKISQNDVILKNIQELLKNQFKYDDIGILVRTNNDGAQIAQALTQKGLPVYVHASGGFYDKREVLDALCLLDFIIDPHQDDIFFTLGRTPWIHLADAELLKWGQSYKNLPREEKSSFWNFIKNNDHENIKILADLCDSKKIMPLSFVFEKALTQFGYFEFAAVNDLSGKREANLRKLLSDLRAAETLEGFNAIDFVHSAWLDAEKLGEEKEASSFVEPEKINIMTIHKSKGLKFECVIVADCGRSPRVSHKSLELAQGGAWAVQVLSDKTEEKISPLALMALKEQRVEHEKAEFMRLFYVATTRSAQRLFLISKKDFHPQSWIANIQNKLSFNEGIHDQCYEVTYIEDEKLFNFNFEKNIKNAGSQFNPKLKIQTVFEKPPAEHKYLQNKMNIKNILESQTYGTQLHAVFETLNKNPDLELQVVLKSKAPRIEKKIIEATLESKQLPLKRILKVGFSEWPFNFKLQTKVYSGRIDLWGEVDGKIYIIDFKSGESELAKYQLEFYAIALKLAGYQWENIIPVIVKPRTGEFDFIELQSYEQAISNFDLRHRDRHQDQI